MTKKKLIITTPAKGGLPSHYFKSFLDLIGHGLPDYESHFIIEDGNNALNLSRNIIVDDVICGDHPDDTKVLMIDSDHKWDLDKLGRILGHDYSKYHVVSGTYCKKQPGRPIWLGLTKKGAQLQENGLIECSFLPTGFLCTTAGTLRVIAKAHPEREFYYDEKGESKTMTELFPIGVRGPRTAEARLKRIKEELVSLDDGWSRSSAIAHEIKRICYDEQPPGRCVGEDYCFSYLATEAGFSLWIDTKVLTPHVGTCDFPILADAIASPAPIPMNASDTQQW